MIHSFDVKTFDILQRIFTIHNISFSKERLNDVIVLNPYFPSLYGITKVLDHYNIVHRSLIIVPVQLDQLQTPFVAFVDINSKGDEDFVCVEKISDSEVTFFHDKKYTVPRTTFLENWNTGITLLIQASDNSIEPDYELNIKKEKKSKNEKVLKVTFGLALMIFLISSFLSHNQNISLIIPLFIVLVGIILSILIISYELGSQKSILNNICTLGKNTNCSAVLKSKGSKLFGVSWSNIGISYFLGTLLFIISYNDLNSKIQVLAILFILSALYVPYSLFYQYRIVKQWCILCLGVQFLFVIGTIWAMLFVDVNPKEIKPDAIIHVLISCFAVFLILKLISPYIEKYTSNVEYKNMYRRLLGRKDVFESLIENSDSLPDGWQEISIVKGELTAPNTIVKICNPYCAYCKTSHEYLNSIISRNVEFNVHIVFVIADVNGKDALPVKTFLALEALGEKEKMFEAIDYWYLNNDLGVEGFIEKYPLNNSILDEQKEKINLMSDWIKKTKASYTPTFYFNGKLIPSHLDLDDIINIS